MKHCRTTLISFAICALIAVSAWGEEPGPAKNDGELFTLWPLIDYRGNPAKKSSRLSLLGPLFTFEKSGEDSITALRPLFYSADNSKSKVSSTDYLYPLASAETTPETSRLQLLHILQKDTFRKGEQADEEHKFMIFPLIISGESKKYGPYLSIFPLYGDIYERFWKDEYHFILFPLYSRTVKNGATNYNLLYPFFTLTSGEKESGFQFWPIFGNTSKEGVYKSTFALWPIFQKEERGLNTANPSERLSIFPLYGSFDSSTVHSRTLLWPFFGHSTETVGNLEEWDFFWPFWLTIRGDKHEATRFLPFYSADKTADSTRNWYLWPLFRTDTMQSSTFRQERQRILYFLFSDKIESWAVDDKSRRRTALWPLFVYNRDTSGNMSLTMPAPVEPVLDKDGIENSWAPFWRLYVQRWNDKGDSSLSLLWNLYWHESSSDYLAWEIAPIFRYRGAANYTEVQFLKGLVQYRDKAGSGKLSLFWLPFGFEWGGNNLPEAGENRH